MGGDSQKPKEAFSINPAPASITQTYPTPAQFNASLRSKIKSAAAAGAQEHDELRLQFAYDRLLARVFTLRPDQWVLKGGTALLARLPTEARHSMDVDLFFQNAAKSAVDELREAAELDLDDHFTFDLKTTGEINFTGHNPTIKVTVTS